ncbi:MAG: NTP transferase domain-containing protein [Gemmatimonadota bacterium]|nr:NTP transferase domain-containing protein [Gemmatimonadota bacterium]
MGGARYAVRAIFVRPSAIGHRPSAIGHRPSAIGHRLTANGKRQTANPLSLTLVVLAAGMSTRFGRLKQLEPVGPSGEALLDYGIFDALRAGFERMVLVIRPELEATVRAHCAVRWGAVPIAFAHQTLDQVPGGQTCPPTRVKPWGTAHAVLAAAPAVDGPFGVANADDFYGARAYQDLAAHLRAGGAEHALVGYRLDATLSPHGGVSRGWCETTGDHLRHVTEIHDIRLDGAHLRGRDPGGILHTMRPESLVSMNLWGFQLGILPLLRDAFGAFFATSAAATDGEFLLSNAVGDLVAAGDARVRVLATDERWMGVTYPDDRETVADRLRALVADGRYPAQLEPSA